MESDGAESDEDLFILQPSTLTALNSFLDEQTAEYGEMVCLATRSYPASSNLTDFQLYYDEAHTEALTLDQRKDQNDPDHLANQTNRLDILGPRPQSQAVPVDTFKKVFKLVLTPCHNSSLLLLP